MFTTMLGPSIPRNDHRPGGFTLVELIIIVAVLAIMAAMVVPRIGQADSSVLRMAAQQLAADLQLIQNEAMAHGDQIRVLDFYTYDGTSYTLTNEIEAYSHQAAHDDIKLHNALTNRVQQVKFGEDPFSHLDGVWMVKSNLDTPADELRGVVRFGRFGQVVGLDFDPTIVLARGDKTLRIQVASDTGDITIDADFGRLSEIGSLTLPGPSSATKTVLN